MANAERRSRTRFWLLYAAAWTPLAVLYALLIRRDGAPAFDAAIGGITSVVTAAILGVAVHWFTGWAGGPERGRLRLLVLHLLGAFVYGAAWSVGILAMMAAASPEALVDDFIRVSLGWQFLSGITVYGVVAGASSTVRAWRSLRAQEQAAARNEALRVRAELSALRAQLDPHFLFNTLHSVMALVRSDQRAAEQAIERFGDLLRYVLDVNRERRDEAPLADELDFVRSYLALEQLRLGDRLRVIEDVDTDILDAIVPTYALQPLVENAIHHAIAPHARGGTITLAARVEGADRLVLEVRDDGPGAVRDTALAAGGIGLGVLRQRLEVLYGRTGWLDVKTAPGEGFVASISLPLRATVTHGDPIGIVGRPASHAEQLA